MGQRFFSCFVSVWTFLRERIEDISRCKQFYSAELKMIFSVALFVINEEEQEYVALFLPVYGRFFHNAQHFVKTRKSQWVTRPCDFTDYYANKLNVSAIKRI